MPKYTIYLRPFDEDVEKTILAKDYDEAEEKAEDLADEYDMYVYDIVEE